MTKLSSIHSFPSPYWALLDEMAKGTEIHLTFSSQKEAEALRFTLYRFHGLLKKASEHSHTPPLEAIRYSTLYKRAKAFAHIIDHFTLIIRPRERCLLETAFAHAFQHRVTEAPALDLIPPSPPASPDIYANAPRYFDNTVPGDTK